MVLSMLVSALMALPPMDASDRESQASAIVTAKVTAVYSRSVDVKWGSDTQYVIQATVTESKKGTLAVGQNIYVHAQQTGKRPDGWTGPQGQNRIPGVGASATFYLRQPPGGGALSALTPNGID